MQGKNHVALALAIPLGAAMSLGPEALPPDAAGWGGLVIGSLAPDLDGGGTMPIGATSYPGPRPGPLWPA